MNNLRDFFLRFRLLIGRRIYLLFALAALTGFLEGLGITLFLPILQSGFGDDTLSRFLETFFGVFGLRYSFNLMLAVILAVFFFRSVSIISYKWFFGGLLARLKIRLRKELMQKIMEADYLFILKKEIGYLNNAVVREVARVVEAFNTFMLSFNYFIYASIYITLCMVLNYRLTVIILVLSPIFIIVMKRLNAVANRLSRAVSQSYGNYNSILIQTLSKLKYLKSTFSFTRLLKKVDGESSNLGMLNFRMSFVHALSREAFEPVVVLIVVGLLFYHVTILEREVSEVIFLSFLFLQVARQFLNAQSSYRSFVSSIGSIEVYDRIIRDLGAHREDLHHNGRHPDFSHPIILKDVHVTFPNGKAGLNGVSVRIRPNTTVALVGYSGSGKSTVANVVTGIIRPSRGEVLMGDIPYGKLNLRELRAHLGYVTQENIIFNATIQDNILLWNTQTDEVRLRASIAGAHMKGFVDDLPDGSDTLLGDNGLDISGGQRQRITIARELYKDAKLLILDEATSSLDSKSEKKIYENLAAYKGKKTMIVIAHRLSTIKNADYVYVLDEGRVAEEGSYDDLYRRKGEFTRMIDEQKLI